jgi:hypothetical protein
VTLPTRASTLIPMPATTIQVSVDKKRTR